MELLQILASLSIFLLLSNAVEFTDEQAGLLATGNYDDYNGKHQVDPTAQYNNAGVSEFKNPNAPLPAPQRLPIHITRPTSYTKDSPQEQPYYDYRDENSDLYYSPSPNKQIPAPNNYPSTPPVNTSTDPNAPKEYNYQYEKVDDADPNHITAVHREAHQSTFKFDNSDPSQPPQYGKVVRPVGFHNQGAQTNLNSRYPNKGPNSQRTDSEVYPNPPNIDVNADFNSQYHPNDVNQINNYPQPPNDISKSNSYPQPTNFNSYPQPTNFNSYPQPTNFNSFPQAPNLEGGEDGLFNNPMDKSRNTNDFNTAPYFQNFIKRFKFVPRTAGRW